MKTVLITGCSSGYGLETARHTASATSVSRVTSAGLAKAAKIGAAKAE